MYILSTLLFAPFLLAAAAPPPEHPARVEERGNGSEITYIAECQTAGYGSSPTYWEAAYWSDWSQSQGGYNMPNSIGHQSAPTTNPRYQNTFYTFPDVEFSFNIQNQNPGWYQIAGYGSNKYGTQFTCRMDNGRQLYVDTSVAGHTRTCNSIYYCQ